MEEAVGEGWEQCDDCHDTHYVKDYEMFDDLENENGDGDEIMPPVEGEPSWMETVRECLNEPVGKGLDGVDQEFKDLMVEHYDMLTPEFQNLVRESGLAPDQQDAAGDIQHAMLKEHTTHEERADANLGRTQKTGSKQPAPSVQVNGSQSGADKAKGTRAPFGHLYGAGRHESRSMNLAEGHTDAAHPQVCQYVSTKKNQM